VPGVTAIDAASLVRSKTAPQPRNRLLSWISGEYQADLPSKAEAQAIAPPDDEVRREILRLELEAHVANLQAEAAGAATPAGDVAGAISGEAGPAPASNEGAGRATSASEHETPA
jgi:hypothetical protein